ncbi:MAG TPA: 50S ribosomal protein L4 [Methanomassiliicoccales archaeon]|nr:50S ribosomal protein L4 [Methanomassiliicoccales archaeon]
MAVKKHQVNVYSVSGEVLKTTPLPKAFATLYRPDVIRKAVVAEESNARQPYGSKVGAGMRHSVSTWGKGRGAARVQRLAQGARGAESPNNVGGRRAFPPKVERSWEMKVNKKERVAARKSALATMANVELVKKRGHQFAEGVTLPVIFEDSMEQLATTADVMQALVSVGISDDVTRAKEARNVRPGKGKMRGRRFKGARGVLIVVADKAAPIFKGAANLSGVEIVSPEQLNAGTLAPGGDAGRLAVFSEAALKIVEGW